MEVEFGGRTYVLGRMPPMDQFHVMRKFNPISEALRAIPATGDRSADDAEFGRVVLEEWGKLSREDCEYIFSAVLSRVQRRDEAGGLLTPVWVGGERGRLQFQDIFVGDLVGLVTIAVQYNLRPTSPGEPSE